MDKEYIDAAIVRAEIQLVAIKAGVYGFCAGLIFSGIVLKIISYFMVK